MTSIVGNVAFDCADPYPLARFWSAVTGQPVDPECRPGDEEVWIDAPGRPTLYFNRVPEPKTGKNRVHVCLRPADVARDAEVERLLGLGATLVVDRRRPDQDRKSVV